MSDQPPVQVSIKPTDRLSEPGPSYMSVRQPQQVVVTDIQMPFWSMVWFMVKWALASIPALLILVFLGIGVWVIVLAALH